LSVPWFRLRVPLDRCLILDALSPAPMATGHGGGGCRVERDMIGEERAIRAQGHLASQREP